MSRRKKHPSHSDRSSSNEGRGTAELQSAAPSTTADFPVVGIGASAGGLEPFKQMLRAVPTDTGMAFVIVQHLAPDFPSMLTEILSRETRIPIEQVDDEPEVQPGHVYIIPPDRKMVLSDGRLRLFPRDLVGRHRPIDAFLRSLAKERGHRSIGVILSGTASDGTLGLEAIKAEGGITFAQDGSAEYEGMPQSAIAAGCVDFVLPPGEIAAEIARIGRHPFVAPPAPGQPAAVPAIPENPAEASRSPEFGRILEVLRVRTEVDFTKYRSNTLNRRISRRMVLARLDDLKQYVALLEKDSAEVDALHQDFLINVTSFFRDPEAFEAVSQQVFPRLVKDRSRQEPLRVWVLGCSSGEEAYSIAIAYTEFAERTRIPNMIQVFATDLSSAGIETARIGLYPKTIEADVSPERLRRFFVEQESGYRIAQSIRDLCVFARHNLLADPPFSRIDLVSCRNILIYMEPPLQERAMSIFHYALNPGAFLWLGTSEAIGSRHDLFGVIDPRQRIFVRRPGTRRLPSGAVAGAYRSTVSRSVERAERDRQAVLADGLDPHREADRILLSKYAPPSVLVDCDWNILQFRGDTSPYLVPAQGRASLNLMKMAREGLFVGVRAAFERAREDRRPARVEHLWVNSVDGQREVDVEVVPVERGSLPRACFLVLFQESDSNPRSGSEAVTHPVEPTEEEPAHQIRRLTQELTATREYLESVIEQQESSNEELQAANEEVQSTNEELQSINEELETSKEEIQSSNEELNVINEELQTRNIELAQSHNDLSNLIESVQMPIVLLGRDLRIRRFSPSAEKVLNLIPADVGRPIGDLNLPIEVPVLDRMLRDVIGNVRGVEHNVRGKDGRFWSARIRPYETHEKTVEGAVFTLVDVDALQRAQAAVLDSEERYRLLVRGARDFAIIMLDQDGRIADWNAGAERIFGYEAAEIIGSSFARFFLPEDVAAGAPDRVLRMARADVFAPNEHWMIRKDGSQFWGSGSTTALVDGGGPPRGFAKVIRDLTHRKVLEDDLRRRVEDLAAADRSKDEFLAMLAHELRNPLAPLTHALELLEDQRTSDDLREEALQIMNRHLARMAHLVDDLLDVSRITHGKIPLRKGPVELSQVLRLVVEDMEPQIGARRQTIHVELPEEPIWLDADAARLHQIFANLLDNACKFSTAGGRIHLAAEGNTGRLGQEVVVSVRDQGIGIDARMLPHVFEIFTQADSSSSRSRGGLGIGLMLAKNLVEMHGGTIEARSEGLNQGSEFVVRLPVALAPPTSDDRSPKPAAPAESPPQRILVVDDNVDGAETLGHVLRSFGHEVRVAFTSEDGLAQAQRFHPQFIFLDLGLPGMDGLELARVLRRIPAMEGTRLVALTGYGRDEDRRKTREAGFDEHIVKPAGLDVLKRMLATLAS